MTASTFSGIEDTDAAARATPVEMTKNESSSSSLDEVHLLVNTPDGVGRREFSMSLAVAIVIGIPGYFSFANGYSFHSFAFLVVISAAPLFLVYLYVFSYLAESARNRQHKARLVIERYFNFADASLANFYSARGSIPILTFVDGYLSGRIVPRQGYSLLDIFEMRYSWASFLPPLSGAHILLRHWLDRLPWMDRIWPRTGAQDSIQLERAFYNGYLDGTSGQIYGRLGDVDEQVTLEDMQEKAMQSICKRLNLTPGDRHLDLGSDGGHLAIHAARNHRSSSTAILIDSDALEAATELAEKHNLSRGQVLFICADYSTIASSHYDKITWINVPNPLEENDFDKLLQDIHNMLADNGVLLLEAGGLRHSWQLEDWNWAIFLESFILAHQGYRKPVHWYVQKFEKASFDVKQTENTSAHCAATYERWYWNWEHNREQIIAKYGERRWKIWAIYLAWAITVIKQGTMASYQFVATKSGKFSM